MVVGSLVTGVGVGRMREYKGNWVLTSKRLVEL